MNKSIFYNFCKKIKKTQKNTFNQTISNFISFYFLKFKFLMSLPNKFGSKVFNKNRLNV